MAGQREFPKRNVAMQLLCLALCALAVSAALVNERVERTLDFTFAARLLRALPLTRGAAQVWSRKP